MKLLDILTPLEDGHFMLTLSVEELEKQWVIELDPPAPEKKPFLCRIGLHKQTRFTHLSARQTVLKCRRCGDESGRRKI